MCVLNEVKGIKLSMQNKIRKAEETDKNQILALYHSLIGTEGCTWSLEYPTMEDINQDLEKGGLYILSNEDNQIIGAATAEKDNELEKLGCWSKIITNPCDLHRIGIRQDYQNLGLAKELIKHIEKDVVKKGFDGIRFLVSKTNPNALALYNKLDYKNVGETNMYDINWFCYEKKL